MAPGGVNVVTAAHDFKVFAPDAGVNLGGLGEDAGVVGTGAVQTGAVDGNMAATHAEAFQVAVAEDGPAGSEGDAGGVDKAAAVYLYPGRVGHNHFGTPAGHFDIAVQQAGVAAVDLVDDNFGFAAGQPGVALNPAADLGGGVVAAVVEDGAFAVNIKLAVLVHGDAAGTGGLDVDLRGAVGALQDGGLLVAGGGFVGGDAGGVGGADGDRYNQGAADGEHE